MIMLLITFTVILNSASTQITVGIKSNLLSNDTEVASGNIDLDKTIKAKQGYSLGGVVEYGFDREWSLNSEILYKHIGFQIVQATSVGLFGLDVPIGATLKTTVNYLELPILLKYNRNLGNISAFVEAGPSINYAMNGKIKTVANSILDFNVSETKLNLESESYNRISVAANIGTGITYPFSKDLILSAGVRYSMDLSDSVNLPIIDTGIKNNSWGIGLSIGKRF